MAIVPNLARPWQNPDLHWHGNADEVHGATPVSGGGGSESSGSAPVDWGANAGYILAEDYRSAGSDQATIEAALVAGAAEGKPVWLEPGRTYRVTTRIVLPSNSGLMSNGTAIIDARATDFSSATSPGSGSTTTNTVLRAQSVAGVRVEGIKIVFTPVQNSWVNLVSLYSCTRPVVRGCDLSGLCRGYLIAIDSCVEADVSHNVIHSSQIDATATGQLTGIAVDDTWAGTPSRNCAIHHNVIRDLTVTPAVATAFGFETDGINLVRGYRISITDNFISNTGEGIDTFASYCTLQGNLIEEAILFGIKLIHGASFNSVQHNVIKRCGLSGIYLAATSTNGNSEGNHISHNTVTELDPYGTHSAISSVACIQLGADGGATYKAVNNIFACNILDPGVNGKLVVLRGAVQTNHYIDNFVVRPGTAGSDNNFGNAPGMYKTVHAPINVIYTDGKGLTTEYECAVANFGAGSRSDFTLPEALKGNVFGFYCAAATGIRIIPPAGRTIRLGSATSTAGPTGYIQSVVIGSYVELIGIADVTWVSRIITGTWTAA